MAEKVSFSCLVAQWEYVESKLLQLDLISSNRRTSGLNVKVDVWLGRVGNSIARKVNLATM